MNLGKEFWAVWRETGGAPPSKRHYTKQEAICEAARLAQQTNEKYYVLEAIGMVEPIKIPTQYTEFGSKNTMTSTTNFE